MMSGNLHSPKGNRESRIQAARNWLDRAEQQFADGQDVLAAATLMLAQAEMKLMVEAVSISVSTDEVASRPLTVSPRKRNPVLNRNILAVGSMAACLVIGLIIGQYMNQGNPSMVAQPSDQPSPAVRIADENPADAVIDVEIPVDVEAVIPVDAAHEEKPEETFVASATPPASTPPAPVYRLRPRPNPEPVAVSAVESGEPVDGPVETVVEPAPSVVPANINVEETSSDREISPAEVALRTIRALSERLLMEGKNQ